MYFPLINDATRKIIHIDMDAFFAAVEERDCPELKNKPVVIAKHPKKTHGKGVVSTANYLARNFGIHSAQPAIKAYQLCPQAIFIEGNHQKYREISQQIRNIFQRFTDVIEPLSIDEAYLDVTYNKLNIKSAIKIAKIIQHTIWQETKLTCSAGVSYNKFLAKLASDFHKPRGLTLITPEKAVPFLKKLPIEKFYGVGKKSVPKLHEMGIFTGADLYDISGLTLIKHFGKMGYSLFQKVHGIHNAPVNNHRIRKSVGKERTFAKLLTSKKEVAYQLKNLADLLEKSLEKAEEKGKTLVLKVRFADFTTITKRVTLDEAIYLSEDIYQQALTIFESVDPIYKGIRLLGITLTNLTAKEFTNLKLEIDFSKV